MIYTIKMSKHGIAKIIDGVFVKPLVVGAICVAADKFLLNEPYLDKSLYFGGAASVGVFLASSSGLILDKYVPKQSYFDSETVKTLEARIVEVGFGAISYYGVSSLLLNIPFNKNELLKKLGILVVADVLSETLIRVMNETM